LVFKDCFVSESSTAIDVTSIALTFEVFFTDEARANSISVAANASIASDILETARANDVNVVAGSTFKPQVSETATAQDVTNSGIFFGGLVDESVNISDNTDVESNLNVQVNEFVQAAESFVALAVFFASIVEGVTAADIIESSFLWNPIPDDQNADWVTINNAQGSVWNVINSEATTVWQNVNDTQSSAWNAVDTSQTPDIQDIVT
jgi:hypothetical protein